MSATHARSTYRFNNGPIGRQVLQFIRFNIKIKLGHILHENIYIYISENKTQHLDIMYFHIYTNLHGLRYSC